MKVLMRLLILFFICNGCQNSPNETEVLLQGHWQGSNWLIAGKPSGRDASAVSFEFTQDMKYTASFGAETETGTYRVARNKLYTIAQGNAKIEKSVGIAYIDKDSLVMDMNRQGDFEQLLLKKK